MSAADQLLLLGGMAQQPRIDRGVVETPDVRRHLLDDAPVAVGVSGGKDSQVCALAVNEHLDAIGHRGPRLLVHADLGRVEWRESQAVCARLAERLGLELVTVRRAAGDLMDRWLVRWSNNVARYADLECVKLILPWSTASMRFCTSELKTAIICREMVRRFPGQAIISATGIRRQESPKRARAPIASVQAKLTSRTHKTTGLDWRPLLEWRLDDVLAFLASRGVALHPAYTFYGSSRLSCSFCILGSAADLRASASCPDNAPVYREMVDLEITSTFAFQSGGWLGDVAPALLTDEARAALVEAKVRAKRREAAEAAIPDHLLYEEGWPKVRPTWSEAVSLCEVREVVAAAVGIEARFVEPAALIGRYDELMRERAERIAG